MTETKDFAVGRAHRADIAVPDKFPLRQIVVAVALTCAGASPLPLFAQASPAAAAGAAHDEKTETIVVTGSRIRGAAPTGSTVVSVGREDIELSSALTTAQLLQQVPQVFNLGVSENSRGQAGGSGNITYGSSVNLRGIGPYATLTLLNGRRVVPQGTSGQSIDPSVIPRLALERLDVMGDGASAIYGSDAVAGVVNLIMRRKFDGAEAYARYGAANNYDEHSAGGIFGHSWDGGRYTVAFQNDYHSALNGSNRDFYTANQVGQGGRDYSETLCSPGNIVIAGVSYAIPVGGVTAANAASLRPGTTNKCDNLKTADLLPKQTRNSLTFTYDQDINDKVSIYADGFVTRRDYVFTPRITSASLTVPSTNAFYVRPVGAPAGTSETVQYSFANDLPPNIGSGHSASYQATLGSIIKLPRDWKFEANYSFGYNDDQSITRTGVVTAPLNTALASNNPATAFNPFAPNANNAAVALGFANGYQLAPGTLKQHAWEAKIDGALFALPGGDLRTALGYEGRKMNLDSGLYTGTTTNVVATPVQSDRTINSVYAELFIPIIGKANAMPGIRALDLDLAERYDRYSDFGSTTNPKIGANWTVMDGLVIKGSHGTSFRAPLFSQLKGNSNQLYVQNYSDPTLGGAIRQGVTLSGGNLNLKPETAKTNSLGFDFIPKALKGAKFNVTWFDINYENQITSYLSDLTILNRESQFAGTNIIQRNPAASLISALQSQYSVANNNVVPANVSLFVDGRANNLGRTVAKGFDFSGSYDWSTGGMGEFGVGVNGTYFTKYQVAISAAAPLVDVLNTIYNPLKYKARGSFRWSKAEYLVAAFVNYTPSYDNNLVAPVQKVSSLSTLDLHLGYTVALQNKTWGKELNVGLDVSNLFNSKPPYVNVQPSPNGGGGFDATLTNPVGRIVSLSADLKF